MPQERNKLQKKWALHALNEHTHARVNTVYKDRDGGDEKEEGDGQTHRQIDVNILKDIGETHQRKTNII